MDGGPAAPPGGQRDAAVAIRLLIDHGHSGLLGWLPGGFAVLVVAYVALTAVGVLLAGWSRARAKGLGRRG
ncbi:hypothetical protein AB0N81_22985 [Streptomyces sp. NPDC093510]|uniref:hypothetical protein n=1 Tax=Streptomyces sp. NPDC093510 TaxID=3155199 RepID=UPI0034284B23